MVRASRPWRGRGQGARVCRSVDPRVGPWEEVCQRDAEELAHRDQMFGGNAVGAGLIPGDLGFRGTEGGCQLGLADIPSGSYGAEALANNGVDRLLCQPDLPINTVEDKIPRLNGIVVGNSCASWKCVLTPI